MDGPVLSIIFVVAAALGYVFHDTALHLVQVGHHHREEALELSWRRLQTLTVLRACNPVAEP